MADQRLTKGNDSQPEVRLELTNAEGRQVWALYSERPHSAPEQTAPLGRYLEELLAIAWEWRRRILVGAGIGAALGVVYLLLSPSVYVVRALVHIEQRDSVLQQYEAVRTDTTFIATQAEVFHSPSIVANAFDSLGLPARSPGLIKRARMFVQSLVPFLTAPPSDPKAAAVLAALAALDTSPVLGTEVMAISYRTADPQGGVRFVDALIDRYREYVRELETEAHQEGLDLLRAQDRELALQREALEQRYGELHSATLALGDDANALSIQKLRLEEQARAVVNAQGRRIELENRLALHRQNGGPPEERGQLVEELRAAEAAMADLRSAVSERHPDVRRLEQRTQLLREQIERNGAVQIAELERELGAVRRTEQMLSQLHDGEWAAAKTLEERRLKEVQVRQEIERLDQKRDAVLALLRDKELQVLSRQSDHSGTVVRVLDPPTVPIDRVWPITGVVLLLFGMLGALGGLGAALYAERKGRAARVHAPVWIR